MKNSAFVSRVMSGLVAVAIIAALSQPPPRLSSRVTLEMLPNPVVMRILCKSQMDFMADLFWVRMASMASRAEAVDEHAALIPMGNLLADLTPKFKYPYFMAGVMAPVFESKTKTYANADEAIVLMGRGLEAVPDYSRLSVQKAYSELFMKHDAAAAGYTLMRASKQPDALPYLAGLATRLLAQGGEFDRATLFAQEMAQSDDPQVRADYEIRQKEIELERRLTQVDRAVVEFKQRLGHAPEKVDELVAAGLLPAVPQDPFGGTIVLLADGAHSTEYKGRLRAFMQGDY